MKHLPLFLLLAWLPVCTAAELEIKVTEPEWRLDPVGPPLGQREALLQPSSLAIALNSLVTQGEYQEAIALIENRIDLDERDPFKKLDPALLLWIGQVYMTVERYEEAETYLQGALAKLPDFVRAHQALGVVYLLQARFEEARSQITRAVALGGANPELLGYLGYVNHELDNDWGSISAYQQALMLDYENPEWQRGLLYGLIAAHQYDSALTFIDSLLEKHFDDKDLWLYRAQAALRSGDNTAALTSLEVAIELGESDKDNLHVCALLHLEIGSTPRAIELLEESYAQGLDFTYLDQTLAWLIAEERWDFAAELVESLEADETTLDDVERSKFLSRRAAVAAHEGRDSDAAALLEQAVDIDPANSSALIALADLYAEQDEYVRAGLFYERASAFDDVEERALLGHAQMAIDRADYETALELLREASEAAPNRYDLRANIEILENIVAARQE